MVTSQRLLDELRHERLMPIVRSSSAELASLISRTLIGRGYTILEISLTTPGALDVIREVSEANPEVRIGAGTVLRAEQSADAKAAGAQFIVTPGLAPSIEAAAEIDLPALVGALTPSEIIAAVDRGASAVKLFPAEVGGPAYFSALRAPLPDVPLIPVGGVTVETGAEYLRRGALGLGLGSPLIGSVESDDDVPGLIERADAFRAMVASTR
jgi:2-dehydro-3-deoxyphosphogluconate aldolase/(4S)-4-hydroxy-2-oxoglutarate aldolase